MKTETDPKTMQLIAQLIYTIEEYLEPENFVRHSNSFLMLKKLTTRQNESRNKRVN